MAADGPGPGTLKVELTTFAASEADIRAIRDAVFGAEQGVPRAVDWDGADPSAVHTLARDDPGAAVGTGRLLADGRIGRLAVLPSSRGRGIGTRMLELLVSSAHEQGMKAVYLHAQVAAVGFYRRCGFRETGDTFLEADIEHITMSKAPPLP